MFKVLLLISISLLVGCQAPMDEFGRVLGCTAKGTACNSGGANGLAGASGEDGTDGINGATGTAGVNGTSISVVSLCGSAVALCIGDKLFTSSNHAGGGLEELPSGSSFHRGSCRVLVGTRCEVTR